MSDSDFIERGHREMTRSDVLGGSCQFAGLPGVVFYCTVGVFDQENPLVAAGGGRSPQLVGLVEIAAEDVPADVAFGIKTDMPLEVTDAAGRVRQCRVASWSNLGPLWQMSVIDVSDGA